MPVFPKHYSVPRDGRLVAVTVRNPDELRTLRTELELLRRVNRQTLLRAMAASPNSLEKYTRADSVELKHILYDASHPMVREMIAQIDRDFENTGKDIMMAIVNDEADNLVLEAIEAGVADEEVTAAEPPIAGSTDAVTHASSTAQKIAGNDELAQATAELAQVVGMDLEQAETLEMPAPQLGDESTTPEIDESTADENPETAPAEDVVTKQVDDAFSESTRDQSQPDGGSEGSNECNDLSTSAIDGSVQIPDEAIEDHVLAEDFPSEKHEPKPTAKTSLSESVADSAEHLDDADCPDHGNTGARLPQTAEGMLAELEGGLRKLTKILSTEVSGEWRQASDAFADILQKKDRVEAVVGQVESLVVNMEALKAETSAARDATLAVLEEVKRDYDLVKRAKRRAEACADAAEASANQAGEDAALVRKAVQPCDTEPN